MSHFVTLTAKTFPTSLSALFHADSSPRASATQRLANGARRGTCAVLTHHSCCHERENGIYCR